MALSKHYKQNNLAQKNFELHAWVKNAILAIFQKGLGCRKDLRITTIIRFSASFQPKFEENFEGFYAIHSILAEN